MKKVLLSTALVVLFGGYVFFLRSGQNQNSLTVNNPISEMDTVNPSAGSSLGSNSATTKTNTSMVVEPPKQTTINKTTVKTTTTPAPKPIAKSGWRDGTYTGPSVDVYFGNVQVSATISGGKLTNISFLDYPRDNMTSYGKSQMSLPRLKQEAISAQSANVNIVSGATQTSRGFMESLASALQKAKA